MAVSLSTFSQTQQHLETAEQAQEQVQETQVQEQVQEGNNNVLEQEAQAEPQVTTETPAQEQPDESVSTFSLPTFEEEAVETQAPTTAAPAGVDWRDALKKADRNEVLKELGVSEFAAELNEFISKGGNPAEYIMAKAIDYNQVSDEELIKDSLKKQYSNLTKDEINRMFARKYGVSEDMLDEEKEDRLLQLKAEGHLKRQEKIEEQKRFKLPDAITPQQDEAYEQWKQIQQSQPKLIEEARNFYFNHEATKALNESKRVAITLGKDVPPFNFVIDKPEVITKAMTDDGTIWRKLTSTATGEPDVRKQQLITLFANNPEKFMQDIFNYGQSFGVRKKIVEEGQNIQIPGKVATMPANTTPTYRVGKYGGN